MLKLSHPSVRQGCWTQDECRRFHKSWNLFSNDNRRDDTIQLQRADLSVHPCKSVFRFVKKLHSASDRVHLICCALGDVQYCFLITNKSQSAMNPCICLSQWKTCIVVEASPLLQNVHCGFEFNSRPPSCCWIQVWEHQMCIFFKSYSAQLFILRWNCIFVIPVFEMRLDEMRFTSSVGINCFCAESRNRTVKGPICTNFSFKKCKIYRMWRNCVKSVCV